MEDFEQEMDDRPAENEGPNEDEVMDGNVDMPDAPLLPP